MAISGTGAITVTGYKELQRNLRKFEPAAHAALQDSIRHEVKAMRSLAQANAATFSKTIPAAIAYSVTQSGASLRIKRGRVTIAGLYERGGKGNPTGWRHPLFGNRARWYPQKVHPYARPAVQARRPLLVGLIRRNLEALAIKFNA